LFSVITEHYPASLILMRSAFTSLLDLAERALPSLTPDYLTDPAPSMKRHQRDDTP
jgi:nitrous oxidase accessory protein NosD